MAGERKGRKRILLSYELLRSAWWFDTDVSELPTGSMFKGSTETSVPNYITLRNNPEGGRIY